MARSDEPKLRLGDDARIINPLCSCLGRQAQRLAFISKRLGFISDGSSRRTSIGCVRFLTTSQACFQSSDFHFVHLFCRAVGTAPPVAGLKGMRLIIAEDDALLALCITDAVEDAGHSVLCCEPSAIRALRCAREEGGDLGLVNISLNEGSTAGLQLAADLKSELGIPSLFVSGQRQDAISANKVALGYLPKPYSPTDLVAAISVAEMLTQGRRPLPTSVPATLELF
jgi:two-component system, response regulator PdtaR